MTASTAVKVCGGFGPAWPQNAIDASPILNRAMAIREMVFWVRGQNPLGSS